MATLRGDQIAPPAIPSPLTPTDEDKQRLLATIQAKREFQADQKRKAIEARQERVAAAKDKQKRAAIRAIMNEKQGGGGKKKYTGQPSAQERARYQAYSPEKKERYMEWLVSTGGLPEEVAKKRIKNLEGTGGAGGGEDRANAAAGRTLSQAQGEFDGSEAGIRNRAARSLAQDNADQFRRSPEVMADREALGLSTDRDRDNLNMPNLAPGVRPRHITSRGAQGIAQPNLRMPNRAKPEEGMAGPTGIEGRVLSGLAGKKYPNRAKAIKDMKYKAQHARDNIGDDAAIRAAAGSGAPVRRPTDLDIDDQPTSVHPRKLVTKDKDTGKLSLNEGLNKGDAKRANAWISSRGKAKDVRAKRKEDALTKWYQRELGIGKTAAREYATGADTAGMTKPERAQHRRDKAKAASDASDAAARATTAGASASAARTRAAQLKADQREADIGRMDVRLRVQPELATADTAAGRLFRKQYNDLVPGTYAADDDPGATAKPGTTTVQPSHRLPDDIEAEYDAKKKALAAKYPERAGGGRHRIPNGKYNRELQDIEKQYKQDLAAAKRQVKRDAK